MKIATRIITLANHSSISNGKRASANDRFAVISSCFTLPTISMTRSLLFSSLKRYSTVQRYSTVYRTSYCFLRDERSE